MDPRLEAELNAVGQAGQAEVAAIMEWRKGQPKPPSFVYHYTTDDGLHGILSSGHIWLTDVFSLNDPSELAHGVAVAIAVARNRGEKGSDHAKMMAEIFSTFPDRGMSGVAHFNVASFSVAGDDLGQWRAYAQNGRGFAIGFHTVGIVDAFLRPNAPPGQGPKVPMRGCFPVAYDDGQLAQRQTSFVNRVFDAVELPTRLGLPFTESRAFYVQLGAILSTGALDIALAFKHPAYQNEQEYRLLSVVDGVRDSPGRQWRKRPHELVSYITCDWRAKYPDAIAEIVIGPAADVRQAERFVSAALNACAYPGEVNIRYSRIPYRPT